MRDAFLRKPVNSSKALPFPEAAGRFQKLELEVRAHTGREGLSDN
jgi:hypothetical protein